MVLSRISPPFERLYWSRGQVIYVLLTRAPLSWKIKKANLFYSSRIVRLACVRHAASVSSEPGSNSPKLYIYISTYISKSNFSSMSISYTTLCVKSFFIDINECLFHTHYLVQLRYNCYLFKLF